MRALSFLSTQCKSLVKVVHIYINTSRKSAEFHVMKPDMDGIEAFSGTRSTIY